MDKFASVYFGPDEREGQRDFLLAMNGAEIIQVSKEQVDNWYNEDVQHGLPGCENHLVLHGEEEVNRFKNIMHTFFGGKEYKITDDPQSKEFRDWLRKRRNGQMM